MPPPCEAGPLPWPSHRSRYRSVSPDTQRRQGRAGPPQRLLRNVWLSACRAWFNALAWGRRSAIIADVQAIGPGARAAQPPSNSRGPQSPAQGAWTRPVPEVCSSQASSHSVALSASPSSSPCDCSRDAAKAKDETTRSPPGAFTRAQWNIPTRYRNVPPSGSRVCCCYCCCVSSKARDSDGVVEMGPALCTRPGLVSRANT